MSGLVAFAHEATTRHVRCEHGELMHEATAPRDLAAVTPVRDEAPHHAQWRVGLQLTGPGHDHCTLAASTQDPRVLTDAPAAALTPAPSCAPLVATPPPAGSGGVALLHSAPKTSPPA
ncbi:MAG: hypothetical protein R3B48_03380 [Kofleriaceae bacterium]